MQRIRIQKTKKKDPQWRDRWYEVLPIDPRDADILRARRSSGFPSDGVPAITRSEEGER